MQSKIIEYGICTANEHRQLAGTVNEQIKLGWQPHGTVFTTTQYDEFFLHQPMVRYKAPAKKKAAVVRSTIRKRA